DHLGNGQRRRPPSPSLGPRAVSRRERAAPRRARHTGALAVGHPLPRAALPDPRPVDHIVIGARGRRGFASSEITTIQTLDTPRPSSVIDISRVIARTSPRIKTAPRGGELDAHGDRGPWAIVLAGGDGVRLRPLVSRIHGDGRPKQYATLLES